jgi:hypothetical protein
MTAFTFLFVCSLNAQVKQRATVEWIDAGGGADYFLCVFGDTVEDVALIDRLLDLRGQEVKYLTEREEVEWAPSTPFIEEMKRLNARFLSVHIIQRGFFMEDDKVKFVVYFLVDVIEREGSKYYRVASNM